MNITIALQNFDVNNAIDATVIAKCGPNVIGKVVIQFNADNKSEKNQFCSHRILSDFDYLDNDLPHYVQAKIIYEASMLVDSQVGDEPEFNKAFVA